MRMLGYLGGFGAGMLLVLAGLFYAWWIRERYPDRYRGLWRYLGSAGRTRREAVALWGAMVAGVASGVVLTAILRVVPTQPTRAVVNFLVGAVMALGIALSLALYRLRERG
jgi:hypothetical protein